jgi:predicted DNA binding protein
MTLYEIEFRAQHDCPFNDLSRNHPKAIIAHWCNHRRDVLEITGDDPELVDPATQGVKVLEEELKVKVLRRSFTDSHAQVVIKNCHCGNIYRSISPNIERHNCMKMEPVIYRDGWEWYRMIAFNQNDVKKFFSSLEKFATVEVISRKTSPERSVRDSFVISSNSLLGSLTEKQVMALISALNQGYYLVPKKVTADVIASRMGVPRTTFEEHLRKAESKVLHALTPYIHLATKA